MSATRPETCAARHRALSIGMTATLAVVSTGALGGCGGRSDVTGLRSNGPLDVEVNAITVDPRRPDVAYIAGDRPARDEGLFVTIDAGKEWKPIGQDAEAIAVDPVNGSVLYIVNSNHRLWRSPDRGKSWARASNGLGDTSVMAVAIDPARPDVVYAGGFTGEGATFFKSVDGGARWARADRGLARDSNRAPEYVVQIVVDGRTPETLYAATDVGLFRSTDGATSWQHTGWNRSLFLLSPPFQWVALDAAKGALYITDGGFLDRSRDGGRTWESVSLAAEGADLDDAAIDAIAVDPSRGGTLYVSVTDHVAYRAWLLKSTNGGAHWVVVASATGRNSANTPYSFDALAVDASGRSVYVGTYDDGVLVCDTCGAARSP